jgi:hypothetical protein
MPFAWSGADPTVNVETETYELGTAQKANEDITITHIRVWSPSSPGPINLAGRTGTIWSTAGTVLSTVSLPITLTAGWTTHALSSPVERTTNQQWVVSFGTGGNYGFVFNGLTGDVVSSDGAVTSLGFAAAPGAVNGRYHGTPGEFPATGDAAHSFYGADIVYSLGLSGNSPPTVSALSLVDLDGTVTAVATVSDVESLTGALVRFDWGDGASSVTTWPDVTESHTYAASGLYAVLCRVTDTGGLTGYKAAPVDVVLPVAGADGVNVTNLLDQITSHASRMGPFERIATHEPKTAPSSGLTGAVWVQEIDPVPALSGLDETAYRITFVLRLYDNMIREPQDDIDPDIVKIVDKLLEAYNGDFTLGGHAMNIDILGAHGPGLRAVAGYINQDGKLLRAFSIYLPVIISDAWTQEA